MRTERGVPVACMSQMEHLKYPGTVLTWMLRSPNRLQEFNYRAKLFRG